MEVANTKNVIDGLLLLPLLLLDCHIRIQRTCRRWPSKEWWFGISKGILIITQKGSSLQEETLSVCLSVCLSVITFLAPRQKNFPSPNILRSSSSPQPKYFPSPKNLVLFCFSSPPRTNIRRRRGRRKRSSIRSARHLMMATSKARLDMAYCIRIREPKWPWKRLICSFSTTNIKIATTTWSWNLS